MDHGTCLGIKASRVPQIIPGYTQIQVEEEADLPGPGSQVIHSDLLEINILMEVHGIAKY